MEEPGSRGVRVNIQSHFYESQTYYFSGSESMAEKIVHEKIEPSMKNLDERVAVLEERLKMGKQTVEDFAKEKPMMALGMALLFGAGLGFFLGKAIAYNKD